MVKQDSREVVYNAWPPIEAPGGNPQREDHYNNNNWSHNNNNNYYDNSVNAVSFGFVATAILICMFLVMAIFERFLRPNNSNNSSSSRTNHGGGTHHDPEAQIGFNSKLGHSLPRMNAYAHEVSVLMPGDNIPTFIAHPAPVPCPCTHLSSICKQEMDPYPSPAPVSNRSSSSIQEN